ncbi:helicase I [Anditalea andensis]|uniref:Helicase I n=2 Tax=Anditalea andensis TaxID=1048983 RepID=A0A074KU12_9BACT|nr:helicase I [Anditalea andensis]
MNSFLENTAKDILAIYPFLKDLVIVLPNRRAGLFFTKHLGNLIDKPQWLPEVKTVEDIFYGYAGARPADNLTLIFELYKVYKSLHPDPENFDKFYYWGEMILKDFNDVDQFMVNAEKLYHHLSEIKEFETDLSYLTESQVQLIKEFWKSFEKQDKGHQEKFLHFWQMLIALYSNFKARLNESRMAYSGMLYRQVVENLARIKRPDKQYIFIGFNAFTKTEELLLKHFISQFGAKVYWDVDKYYLNDKIQEAGLFFRDYVKDPIFGPTFPEFLPANIGKKRARIKTYSIPLKVNQANLVGELLNSISPEEKMEETVVVLPDEQLLFPVLHTLPHGIDKVNVTMGYPVKNAPVYAFLEAVLDMQQYIKAEETKTLYYHKPLIDLLTSVYLKNSNEAFVNKLLIDIQESNMVYVSQERLHEGGPFFKLIFHKLSLTELFPYLGNLIKALAEQQKEEPLQRSYLFQTFKQLNRLQAILDNQDEVQVNMDFFLSLFRKIFREVKLPFEGEPLEGLQVMGVLETRNLDFRRVIICNMNEESFPPAGKLNSMIPFNLRRAFNLPVQEQNDAIYAYTFYRLLHSAEEVHMIYTTAADQGKAGERSRYVHQIMEEMDLPEEDKNEEVIYVPVDLTSAREISIPKSPEIMIQLERYVVKGELAHTTAFSPSALNLWLDCRLKFYMKYIAGIVEKEEVNEEVDPAVFGNLAHLSLEKLYGGYMERKKRTVIHKEDFKELTSYVFPSIEKAIREQYHLEEHVEVKLNGQLAIARDVLQKYILGVLKIDEDTAPFEIISLEAQKRYKTSMAINTASGNVEVAVGGIIDRVDKVGDIIRLIDYKSGIDTKNFPDIASLFDRESNKRNKAAMQTLLYGFLYQATFPDNSLRLKPAIFNLREIFKDDFNPYLHHKPEQYKPSMELEDYMEFHGEFVLGLKGLLEEIFDPKVPFDQTAKIEKCKSCSFSEICGR